MQIFGENVQSSAISLPRYAKVIGYTEWAFFGISHPSNDHYACRAIWNQSQREDIARYLAEAQDEMEEILSYPLMQKWFEDEVAPARNPLIARWGKILSIGTRKEEILSDDALVTLDLVNCTVTITPVQTIPLSEIHIFYPDSSQEIIPSNVVLTPVSSFSTDMTLTITIPRPRLVSSEYFDTPEQGLDYADDSLFQVSVDVHRIYTDNTVQAKLVYLNSECTDTSFCASDYETAYEYIDNAEIGKILLRKNSVLVCPPYREYSSFLLNYSAGTPTLSRDAETALIRLAHSRMPIEPCGCEITQRLWKRDRNTPQILTAERINCPFGMSDGAWTAWKKACNMQLTRMSTNIGAYNALR